MVAYQDLVGHDEMFSNVWEIQEVTGGLCLEVEGQLVSSTEGNTDDSLVDGNGSTEGGKGT